MEPVFLSIEKEVFNKAEVLAERIGLLLERRAVEIIDSKQKNDRGDLRKSISHNIKKAKETITLTVLSSAAHAIFVHEDTRPHYPPLIMIRDWVKRKGLYMKTISRGKNKGLKKSVRSYKSMNDYTEITKIARAIAYKISKKGTKGIKFFDLALKQSESVINKMVSEFNVS